MSAEPMTDAEIDEALALCEAWAKDPPRPTPRPGDHGEPYFVIERSHDGIAEYMAWRDRPTLTWVRDTQLADRYDWHVTASRDARHLHVRGFAVAVTEHIDTLSVPAESMDDLARTLLPRCLAALREARTERDLADAAAEQWEANVDDLRAKLACVTAELAEERSKTFRPPFSGKRKCESCGKMTRITTAGCDHCDFEDK